MCSRQITPEKMCLESRDLFRFCEIMIISRLRCSKEAQMQWNTNRRKSYVAYRTALLPVPLNDLEGHFCCLKPF